jgi:hypothetical protein
MRIGAATLLAALTLVATAGIACSRGGGSGLFRQYEYEEDVYLSLDGRATMYVNSSIPALNALRGTSFDARPTARIDRVAVREYFSTPVTRVTRVTTSRRSNRQFVHVTIEVDDIRRSSETAPFAWSAYKFEQEDGVYVYKQTVGPAAGRDVGQVGWNGGELVAFRLHLPSKIEYHNTRRDIGRGNILAWEQPLAERLRSVPLTLDAVMQSQSILYSTLWLFGSTFVAVALTFVVVIWWVLRRGTGREELRPGQAQP